MYSTAYAKTLKIIKSIFLGTICNRNLEEKNTIFNLEKHKYILHIFILKQKLRFLRNFPFLTNYTRHNYWMPRAMMVAKLVIQCLDITVKYHLHIHIFYHLWLGFVQWQLYSFFCSLLFPILFINLFIMLRNFILWSLSNDIVCLFVCLFLRSINE